MIRCHTLYYSALRADKAFDRAIKKAHGRSATRWTVKTMAPAVRAAYRRKVALDKARARACDIMRKRSR